ncbi:MAG: glycine cleavage system aminomethyltransferase GcvT [Candidatus Omnitrophota bacterium]
MSRQKNLKQTPLYDEHLKLGAKMAPFGEWQMPISYTTIYKEYEATRTKAALFDICHMGEFLIKVDAQKNGLDRLVTSKIKDAPLGSCRYGALCNEQGGIIDDCVVFRMKDKQWMIVVNAATTDKDEKHFRKHLADESSFENISMKTGKLDLQGPLARDILKTLAPGIERLTYYTFDVFHLLGEQALISRTGYTGELGYEIYFPWQKTKELWKKLLEDDNVKPAGLGARDVLRLEMGYGLYGQDMDETISPLEVGLSRFIDFEKDFIGKDALLKQQKDGLKRKTIFFTSESRRSPRHHQAILKDDGTPIGHVTSGTFSFALKKGIGMGLVKEELDKNKGAIFIGEIEHHLKAEIVKKPFYQKGTLRG